MSTTTVPARIRLSRRKGWRKPPGAVNVARPTEWGNPWREGSTGWTIGPGGVIDRSGRALTRQDAVDSYRNSVEAAPDMIARIREKLVGKDLACWCKPGEPCHADVLLEIANGTAEGSRS